MGPPMRGPYSSCVTCAYSNIYSDEYNSFQSIVCYKFRESDADKAYGIPDQKHFSLKCLIDVALEAIVTSHR